MIQLVWKTIIISLCFLLVLGSKNVFSQVCSDVYATALTKNLYHNLFQLKDTYTLFGHQDDLAYGVGWKYEKGRSDIKSVVQDYPALYGWDLAHLELDSAKNIDGVPFENMKSYIKDAYRRGGVVTISWHASNPLTEKSAWDITEGSLHSILPGNLKHEKYKTWLDKVAVFIQQLKTDQGAPIPILFRPFHELTGNWFWWGKNVSSSADFKAIWKFTVDYLQKEKNIHQLLYVYNTADFDSNADFLARYPGDDQVDILSFDKYQYEQNKGRENFIVSMEAQLGILTEVAKSKNKICAIAETGYEAVQDKTWWTNTLYPLIVKYPIAYVLVWRNQGYMATSKKMHYYAPYPGQISSADFKKFYQLPKVVFQNKLTTFHIYQ